jgi:hypothetical protein
MIGYLSQSLLLIQSNSECSDLIPYRFWRSKSLSITDDDIAPVFSDIGAGCAFNKVPTEMDERLNSN